MRKHPRRFKVFVTGRKARLVRGTTLREVYLREMGYWRNRKYVEVAYTIKASACGASLLPPHAEQPAINDMVELLVCQLY